MVFQHGCIHEPFAPAGQIVSIVSFDGNRTQLYELTTQTFLGRFCNSNYRVWKNLTCSMCVDVHIPLCEVTVI